MNDAPLIHRATRHLARGHPQAAARLLLADGGREAVALLGTLAADGPHGAILAERLRFGPPETWLGWRNGRGRVVVKIGVALPADIAARASFRHPNVAPLLDWGGDWMMFRWIDGPPLTAVTPDTAAIIAGAVAALHAAGLTHGDLKPANVVMAAHGPTLIDWGEDCAGTPGWRPDGPHDARERDLYAIAAWLAPGEHAFATPSDMRAQL